MKKVTSLLCVLMLSGLRLFGQTNAKVFETSEIVWAGIDFSKARLIGSEGFTDPDAIVNEYFDKWNQLVLMESKKYDFAKAYDKTKVNVNFSRATERNATVDPNELVINTSLKAPLSNDDLQSLVNSYAGLSETGGVGLVYIVEYFSKFESLGSIYVVFFDLDSRTILYSQNYKTKPLGFGLRNYWANTFDETIKESGKDFEKARREYAKSKKKNSTKAMK